MWPLILPFCLKRRPEVSEVDVKEDKNTAIKLLTKIEPAGNVGVLFKVFVESFYDAVCQL